MEVFGFNMEACSRNYGNFLFGTSNLLGTNNSCSSSYDNPSSKRVRIDSTFSDESCDDGLTSKLSENIAFSALYGIPSPASSDSDLSQSSSLPCSDAAADTKVPQLFSSPYLVRAGCNAYTSSGYGIPVSPMKYKERHRLTVDIQRLNSEQLLQVIDIVLNSEAMKLNNNDELEVDFEVLKDTTLWRLRDYTTSCLPLEMAQPHTKPAKKPSTSSSCDSDDCRSCISCGTTSTPTWRESDGCVHCNACGLRYKKLGVRCRTCGFVPHAANASKPCPKCNCAFS